MDAIEKAFKARGLDKADPKLYEQIVKFRNILYEKGVCTEEEANKLFKKSKTGKIIAVTFGIAATLIGVAYSYSKHKKNEQTSIQLKKDKQPSMAFIPKQNLTMNDFIKRTETTNENIIPDR